MYAIIVDGGRQYRVEEGQELEIDYRNATKGDELTFERVLAVSGEGGLKLGRPTVDGASVSAEVLGVQLGEKLMVQKFRRRKNHRKQMGHRQAYTDVEITDIKT